MNKKGFTLIELLAVVIVLALILAIAVPSISSLINDARSQGYTNNEKMMVKAAKTYLAINPSLLPANIGDIKVVDLSEIQSNQYIGPIKDSKDNAICTGKVVISKQPNNLINYSPYLSCGSNYQTYNNYVTSGLVLYLDGYDAPVSGYWQDKSGSNNHAQIVGSTYDANKLGYVFNGSSYMNIANPIPSQTPSTQEWAVEAVVKSDSTPTGKIKMLINYWNSGLYLSYSSTYRLLEYLNGGTYDYYDYGFYNIDNDKITHVVFDFKYNGDLIDIYINGVDVSQTGSRNAARIPSGIASTVKIGDYLNGTIYELKIYNRYLTNTEVQSNYNIAKQKFAI